MAVLVVSERDKPFHWTTGKRGQGDKQIAPGEVAVLSDAEWNEVPISMRGAGGLRPLNPSPQDEDTLNQTEMDYYSVSATVQLRYLGEAPQGSDPTAAIWTVKRFSHADVAGDIRIAEIQVLNEVPWGTSTGDRDALAWV